MLLLVDIYKPGSIEELSNFLSAPFLSGQWNRAMLKTASEDGDGKGSSPN
jgi:hypothetical protein